MRFGSRAIATALLSATALLVSPAPASLGVTTSLVAQPATASVCRYSGNQLTTIVAQGPRVREQDWFRTHHLRQRSRYQASVQRLVGSTWSTLTESTQKRTPLLATTTTTMPRLTLAVTPPTDGRYRVLTVIQWIGRSGSVVRTQRLVLAHYSGGASSCAPSIPAPTVSVAAGAGTVAKGTAVGGSFSVSGLRGAGTAYVDLMGPAVCDGCTYDSAQAFTVPVSGDGTFALPSTALSSSGYYRWDVTVLSPSQTSDAAWSNAMIATEGVGWSITSPSGDASLNRSIANGPVQVRTDIGGFHYATSVDLTPTIWGPYDTLADANAAACTGALHNTGVAQTFQIGPGGSSHVWTDDLHAYPNKFFRISVAGAVTSNTAFESLAAARVCSTTFKVIP